MRLGLDLLFLIPGESGGRETYARELIRAMYEVQPSLDATAFVSREVAGASFTRDLAGNMRVLHLASSARRPEQWALGELVLLPAAAIRAKVDLVHSVANFGPVTGPFRRVLTLHDLQYRALPEHLSASRRFGTKVLLEQAARRADRIIAVSQFSRNEIVSELGIDAGKVEAIPNGVPHVDRHAAQSEELLRRRHDLGQRPAALVVATNLPHKNLPRAIGALAHISPSRRPVLVIVGTGTDSAALRDHARSADVAADVRLLGFQSQADLHGLFGLASCAVVPSLYEGFGLPVLEAMAHGTPVACSDIAPLREIAGDAALYFSAHNETEIADALTAVIEDHDLAQRLRTRGRRRAAEFSWSSAATATLATYRRALAPGA